MNGCTCHGCGRKYLVDFLVPDELWQRLGMPAESGLLCGSCIANRIEALGDYDAFALERLV